MTLTLDLTTEEEANLGRRARDAGFDNAAQFVRSLIVDDEPSPKNGKAFMTPDESAALWDRLRAAKESGVESIDGFEFPKTPADAIKYWRRLNLKEAFADGPDSPELSRQLRKRAETGA